MLRQYSKITSRQVEDGSKAINQARSGYRISNYADMDTFRLELYNDAIWVKLNLVAFKMYDYITPPMSDKFNYYERRMRVVSKKMYCMFDQEFFLFKKLGVLNIEQSTPKLIHDMFSGNPTQFFCWDRNFSTIQVGLGIFHKFAYSDFNFQKWSSSLVDNDRNCSIAQVGLGKSHKFAYPNFDFKKWSNFPANSNR